MKKQIHNLYCWDIKINLLQNLTLWFVSEILSKSERKAIELKNMAMGWEIYYLMLILHL